MTITCPLCGVPAGVREFPGRPEMNWIMSHLDWAEASVAVACVGSGLNPDEAAGVARIIEEGGERLRLAAHP